MLQQRPIDSGKFLWTIMIIWLCHEYGFLFLTRTLFSGFWPFWKEEEIIWESKKAMKYDRKPSKGTKLLNILLYMSAFYCLNNTKGVHHNTGELGQTEVLLADSTTATQRWMCSTKHLLLSLGACLVNQTLREKNQCTVCSKCLWICDWIWLIPNAQEESESETQTPAALHKRK